MRNINKIALPVLLITSVLMVTAPSHAWNPWWGDWTWMGGSPITVSLKVNPNCSDPAAPNELASLQSAMNTWTAAGADFAFNYAGATSVTNATYNGQNDICWNPSSTGALATTYSWGYGSNMTEADIVFWDNYAWSTSWPSWTEFDVESVGLHEMGHVLGLDHTSVSAAVMWPYINNGEVQRTLHSDDIAGIIGIYGLASGPANFTVNLTYNYGSPVPAGGGSINFDVFLQNNETYSVNFDLWIEVAPMVVPPAVPNRNLTFSGGYSLTRPGMPWNIPGWYPAGNYTMEWNIGDMSTWTAWATDSFPFSKSADDDGSGYALWEADSDPLDMLFEDIDMGESGVVSEFALLGSYPNPFNPSTTISYTLDRADFVELSVYDLSGREITTLVDGYRSAGAHEVHFDATGLTSGVYVYRLTSSIMTASGKMILMK